MVLFFCLFFLSPGIMIGHVTPEAYDGGPIALVQNGDMITIDAKNRTLDLVSSQHIPHTHTHTYGFKY